MPTSGCGWCCSGARGRSGRSATGSSTAGTDPGPAPAPHADPEAWDGACPSRRPRARSPEHPAVPTPARAGTSPGPPGVGILSPGQRGRGATPSACSGGRGPTRSADRRSGSKPRAFSTVFLSSRPDGHPLHAPPCTPPAELPVNAEAAGWPRCRAHPPAPTPSDPRASRAERGNGGQPQGPKGGTASAQWTADWRTQACVSSTGSELASVQGRVPVPAFPAPRPPLPGPGADPCHSKAGVSR